MTDRLRAYREQRNLSRSPEPSGEAPAPSERPLFVVQQHDTSRMHWDVRLEADGVLKSWAVPKGPSTDPQDKRLAIRTEDHPVEYATFEGHIPQGEYGGGNVIVWDIGPYRNLTDDRDGTAIPVADAIEDGHVTVWVEGDKLRGGYALTRTGMRGDPKNWLLVKVDDEAADARRNPVSTQPESVVSQRTVADMDDGGADPT